MNRDSNVYTFLFAAALVLVVASSLAFTATSLKSLQADNIRKEKMQNILATIGIETDREQAEGLYTQYIKKELALTATGSVDQATDAFTLKLNNEIKKPELEQRFPLYIAEVASDKYYIIPLRGAGLTSLLRRGPLGSHAHQTQLRRLLLRSSFTCKSTSLPSK